jgi:hypothetical protein
VVSKVSETSWFLSQETPAEKVARLKREYGEPLCYGCGGRMKLLIDKHGNLIEDKQGRVGYMCPDCESEFRWGMPPAIVMKNVSAELRARERGMIKKKGGGRKAGRKRPPKKVVKKRYGDWG